MQDQQAARRRPGKRSRRPFWAMGLTAILLALVGLFLAGCSVIATAPDLTQLDWSTSTVIYDRHGEEAYRLHGGENRTPVKLKAIPAHVRNAFIAIEDPRFESHQGINPRGIARAAWRSTLHMLGLPGGRLEGGSTITQQLARDGWLTHEVSIKRKLQEAWIAIQLERTYTKDQILEMYLNQIYFGRGAYGIEAAALTFFGKEVGELNLAEGAQLAGMINGPSYFDPYEHGEDSIERRNLVLSAMLKERLITQEQYAEAKAFEPVLGSKERKAQAEGNDFVDYVITILQGTKPGLAERYGVNLGEVDSLARAGLKVYTTLDPELQALAEQAVADQMAAAEREYGISGKGPKPEAAVVAMDPKSGQVLAIVGGRERAGMLEFNRATDALRQPGSVIKPLVAYLPALEAGLSPATILDDAPVMRSNDGKGVWPQNYDFRYLGLKPMRFGVEQSINPMAVRAMQAAGGPAKAADYARRFGLTTITREDENLALALGGISKGTTVLEIATGYSAIANMGVKVEPTVVTRIVDRNGQVLFEAHPEKERVVKPASAYLMIDMLKDVVRKGTAYGFTGGFRGWPAAGKTGTTENNRDAWFTGFTPDLVVTVWNGYDNPDNHLPWTGAFEPVKIWNRIMTGAVTERPADWPRPADVVSLSVCRSTGMLPNELCPKDQVGQELFVRGTEPKGAGNLLVKARAVLVQAKSPDGKSTYPQWQLWQMGCPGKPVDRVFIRRPQPRVTHPTDPWNPKYVPADAANELPTVTCQRTGLWDWL
ncbi:MAG: transglycosylase domain-containing protein [Bacillota bacterium]